MKVSEITGKSRCDRCHEIFDSNTTVEKPIGNGIQMGPAFGMSFIYTDKDHKLMSSSTVGDNPDDHTLHCPKCGEVHLFGFDRVE